MFCIKKQSGCYFDMVPSHGTGINQYQTNFQHSVSPNSDTVTRQLNSLHHVCFYYPDALHCACQARARTSGGREDGAIRRLHQRALSPPSQDIWEVEELHRQGKLCVLHQIQLSLHDNWHGMHMQERCRRPHMPMRKRELDDGAMRDAPRGTPGSHLRH